MAKHKTTASSVLSVALSPQILGMVTKVYLPVLFPLTFLIALAAVKLDGLLPWPEWLFIPQPYNYVVAGVVFVVAVVMWLVIYEQLVNRGDGSPSPTAGRTQTLVATGIYAYCRNPSVWPKLIGVSAVGFALNSPTFNLVLIPILLTISLIEKVVRQEPQLVEVFGESYDEYRQQVPLFVPWGIIFKSKRYQPRKPELPAG
jgi:protein-S-isoprenylcysteine O-methyltransferase Ste14